MIHKELPTAGLIVVKENKLLLAYSKNKKAWYLPGGKLVQGESSIDALLREIKEELSLSLDSEKLRFFCHISAPAFGESKGIIMEQDCYLYELDECIKVNHEIAAVKYFSLAEYLQEKTLVCGVITVFENLIEQRIINK